MPRKTPLVLGQCWISEIEPELGIGVIIQISHKQIDLHFNKFTRCYSINGAPLKRLPLKAGDLINTNNSTNLLIDSIEEIEGIRSCKCGKLSICESEITKVASSYSEVEDALLRGDFLTPVLGQLRIESLYAQRHAQNINTSGWVGGRVQLIPHQINTAKAIVESMPGRFWLADEVGLGKTITAGLALHHLCHTNSLEQVLILVPDSLLIQWYIELYRKFNLPFTMINDYFSDTTPPEEFWKEHNFCLSSLEFVASSEDLQKSILGNAWDLLIVDEAHHLANMENYNDFYVPLIEKTASAFYLSASVDPLPAEILGKNPQAFRSTRQQIPLFPKRSPHLIALENKDHKSFKEEFLADSQQIPSKEKPDFANDPRLPWLIELMLKLKNKKILLIAHTKAKAVAIQNALRLIANINTAMFHEGMSLVQRDKMAAYFAESEDVQLLVCSEIGSEGRNFQFCHHLVLFDYPLSLGLLEQRIGRIDRIGQTETIHLYLPYVIGTPQEAIVRWFNEGVNLFITPSSLGDNFLEQFRTRLVDIALNNSAKLDTLITDTIQAKLVALSQKKDLHFQRAKPANELYKAIQLADKSKKLENWLRELLEEQEVEIEEVATRTWKFHHKHRFFDSLTDHYALSHPFSFSREVALLREDYHFLSADHPLIHNIFTLILASSDGTCSAGYWPDKKLAKPTLYLEATYLLEGFPLRVIIDEAGVVQHIPLTTIKNNLIEGPMDMFRNLVKHKKSVIKHLLQMSKTETQKLIGKKPTEAQVRLDMVRLIVRG